MVQKILITGGLGFIGSHLAEKLLTEEEDVELYLFDNKFRGEVRNLPPEVQADDAVEIVRGDIRDRDVLQDAMEGCDYVYHLAAVCLNRSMQYPDESLSVNLIGSNNVFQIAAELDVNKLLFASSASIYGNQDIPMSESDLAAPQSPYGTAKLAGENLLNYYNNHHDLDYTAFRFFNVYGPRQSTDAYYTSVINVFIKRLLDEKSPEIHGSGEQKMDFIHVKDIARGLYYGMKRDFTGVVNLGSGDMTSIEELAKILIDISAVDGEPKYIPRDVIVSERKASTERAKEQLQFESEVNIEDGLRGVYDWLENETTESATHE